MNPTRKRTELTAAELDKISGSVTTYNFQGFDIRVVKQPDERWIVFADICKALHYKNPNSQRKRFLSSEVKKLDIGLKNTLATCINEDGVTRLAATSGKELACVFRSWASQTIYNRKEKK